MGCESLGKRLPKICARKVTGVDSSFNEEVMRTTIYRAVSTVEEFLWNKKDLFDLETRINLVTWIGRFMGSGYRRYMHEKMLK